MGDIIKELSHGLEFDHPHVIKSYQCWEDSEHSCINSITEYFTSGSLREYRQRNKLLELKAVKKWGRQILQGLAYLHTLSPPVVHGDLRPDKIYINGYSGNIKIGDRGLQVLAPKRFHPGVMPEGDPSDQYTRSVDIFAYGLVMLELVTLQRMDRTNAEWQPQLAKVKDEQAREFIAQCLAAPEERPTAKQLLDHPFLQIPTKKVGGGVGGVGGGGGSAGDGLDGGGLSKSRSEAGNNNAGGGDRMSGSASASRSDPSLRMMDRGGNRGLAGGGGDSGNGGGGGGDRERSTTGLHSSQIPSNAPGRPSQDDSDRPAECEAGSCRGEDYLFQFSGKIRNGKLHFRLHMQYEGDDDEYNALMEGSNINNNSNRDQQGTSKTIDFVYDPEVDTPDEIAAEISSEFNLSSTDRDICAAALKEWLAKEMENNDRYNN